MFQPVRSPGDCHTLRNSSVGIQLPHLFLPLLCLHPCPKEQGSPVTQGLKTAANLLIHDIDTLGMSLVVNLPIPRLAPEGGKPAAVAIVQHRPVLPSPDAPEPAGLQVPLLLCRRPPGAGGCSARRCRLKESSQYTPQIRVFLPCGIDVLVKAGIRKGILGNGAHKSRNDVNRCKEKQHDDQKEDLFHASPFISFYQLPYWTFAF